MSNKYRRVAELDLLLLSMRQLLPFLLIYPLLGEEPQVLLVSPPELREAWGEYAALRAGQGTAIKVITIDQIAKDFDGPDLQEKIRLCARQHIEEHGYQSIILGGDSSGEAGLIPDRDTFHKNMWGNDTDIPSDLYYISPTNWDHDGDGIYGEFEEDREAITYPDGSIAIGRIPVRTAADIAVYGEKVTAHLASEPSFQLTLTCEVRGAYAKVHRAGSELIPKAWPEGKVSFFFNDMTSWDPADKRGSYDLSTANLSEKFATEGFNKWHLHGHGLIDRWVLENNDPFTYSHVKALKNEKQPLVITTVSCFTGHFDATKDPSISEAMLRQPKGGAVLIVAPAREGKPHFHNPKEDFPLMMREGKLDGTTQTMTSFWIAALGEKKSAGLALATAKAGLADDAKKSATYHQGICELNLLGDPTLSVR